MKVFYEYISYIPWYEKYTISAFCYAVRELTSTTKHNFLHLDHVRRCPTNYLKSGQAAHWQVIIKLGLPKLAQHKVYCSCQKCNPVQGGPGNYTWIT